MCVCIYISVSYICMYIHGFDPWAGKIPWRRAWQPTPESHGQRSQAGYNL